MISSGLVKRAHEARHRIPWPEQDLFRLLADRIEELERQVRILREALRQIRPVLKQEAEQGYTIGDVFGGLEQLDGALAATTELKR